MLQRRVVVTGLGAVTPLGIGAKQSWENLIDGKSGLTPVSSLPRASRFDTVPMIKMAASIDRTNFASLLANETQSLRSANLSVQYALVAARMALADAQWSPRTKQEQDCTGVAIGSAIASVDDMCEVGLSLASSQGDTNKSRGLRKVSPFAITKVLPNMASAHVSMAHGLRGPQHTVSTACATGTHAIGDAARMILFGDADVMVCGGTEASLSPTSFAMFHRCKALSIRDDVIASSPFDEKRDGFVMGEGAGVLVLEELGHALKRGARIYAEVAGYGLSGDAYHITQPAGHGAVACIRAALSSAARGGLVEDIDIGYINAHATSTPVGDAVELDSFREVFGREHFESDTCAVSSTKGATGHLLGAAGAVEAIFTVQSLQHSIVPPTLNLSAPSDDVLLGGKMNLVPNIAETRSNLTSALTTSFGFGGTNAALVFTTKGL